MSIVVSHRTARAFHQLPLPQGDLRRFPLETAPLKTGAPCARSIALARAALQRAGLAGEALENLEVIVSKASERRVMPGITCHLLSGELPARTLLEIEKGVFVPDVRLCALEAASYLPLRELVEYYYELCGTYALFPGGNESHRKLKTARTTTEDLRAFFLALRQRNHAAKALRVLRAMGYEMLVIDRAAVFGALPFRRLMASIERHARIKRRYLDERFRARQEELRTFVLRNCRKPDDSPSAP